MAKTQMLNQEKQAKNVDKSLNRAISYACRLLGIREYANQELAKKLLAKGYDSKTTHACLEYLRDNNWLNESRYCESYVRFKSARGIGKARISYELKQKSVDNRLVQQAIKSAEIDWQALCDSVLIKKAGSIKPNELLADVGENQPLSGRESVKLPVRLNLKQYQQLQRFIQYRGFDLDEIRASMRKFIVLGETSGEHDE